MLGIIIAAVVGILSYLFGDTFEGAFLDATIVLLWWYIVTRIIAVAFSGILTLGLFGLGTALGARQGGLLGGVLGGILGGGTGLLTFGLVVLRSIILIAGAYFLHDSVAMEHDGYVWDIAKLIVGSVLVLLPLCFRIRVRTKRRITTFMEE